MCSTAPTAACGFSARSRILDLLRRRRAFLSQTKRTVEGDCTPAFGPFGRLGLPTFSYLYSVLAGGSGKIRKTQDGHLFLILLKSNYSTSRLRPGNSVHAQRLTDSLLVPFYFSMSFQSSRIAPIILRPNPSGKPFPHFLLIFCPVFYSTPKPYSFPRQFLLPKPPIPPFIHSRFRQSNSNNFRNTPDPPNPPASKNSYPLSFQHF